MICANPACGAEFHTEKPKGSGKLRRTCSRRCAAALSWHKNREQRIASISAAQRARGDEIVAQNHERWARPGERERLSQRNREAWSDPETKKRLSEAIAKVQRTPEKRQFYSEMRKALWRDPEYRARVTAANRASHGRPEYRALFSKLLRERWKDPEWRRKWTLGMYRRYGHEPPTELIDKPIGVRSRPLASLPPIPAPPPTHLARPKSAREIEEEAAIAAFLAKRGATVVPSTGDRAALDALPPLRWDREARKETRRPEK